MRKNCNVLFFLIVLLLTCCIIPAAQALPPLSLGKLTLRDAIMISLRYNPTVVSTELTRVNDKFALAAAYYLFEPQFTLGAAESSSQSVVNGSAGHSQSASLTPGMTWNTAIGTSFTATMNNPLGPHYYNPGITVGVTQQLLRGFGTDITLSSLYQAIDTEQAQRLALRDKIVNNINQIIQDYIQVILAEQNIGNLQRTLAGSLQNLEDTKKRIAAGQSAPAELTQLEQNIASQRTSLAQGQDTLLQARQTLLKDMGIDPNTEFTVDDTVVAPALNLPTIEKCQEMALAYDSGYQGLLIQRRALRRTLLVNEDAARWQLSVGATATTGYGSGGSPFEGIRSLVNGYNNSTAVNFSLAVPLNLLPIKQAIVSAKIALQTSAIEIAQSRRDVLNNVITQYKGLIIQKERLDFAKTSQDMQWTVLEQTLLKNKLGRVSQFEVNTQRDTLQTNQEAYLQSQFDFLTKLADFRKLIGKTLDDWQLKIRY